MISFPKWAKKIFLILGLSIILGFLAFSIDHSYFQYPLANGTVGIVAKDNIMLPATSEIDFTANDNNPIQVDLAAKTNDISGDVELIAPNGQKCLQTTFNVKKYPKGFLPRPSRWLTFYAPSMGHGEYKLRITQNKLGLVDTYFYQGPFVLRFILLPFGALFVYFLYIITFTTKNKEKIEKKE